MTDLDASGAVLASYAQGSGIDEPLASLIAAGTAFFEADGLGSVTSLSGMSGITDTYTYNAFGVTTATGTNPNRFRYTGREWDSETGLYYYRARYYDSSIGRFLSEDPIGFKAGSNFYRYTLNSPVVLRDPSGLCPPATGICNSLIFQPKYLTIFSNLGGHLNVNPRFIMAVAIQKSGWNLVHVYGTNSSSHGKPLNNLFGSTYHGGNNIAYPSVQASATAWENNWGPELTDHPQTVEDFTYDLTQNPHHMYNENKGWPGLVEDVYYDLLRHLMECGINLP